MGCSPGNQEKYCSPISLMAKIKSIVFEIDPKPQSIFDFCSDKNIRLNKYQP